MRIQFAIPVCLQCCQDRQAFLWEKQKELSNHQKEWLEEEMQAASAASLRTVSVCESQARAKNGDTGILAQALENLESKGDRVQTACSDGSDEVIHGTLHGRAEEGHEGLQSILRLTSLNPLKTPGVFKVGAKCSEVWATSLGACTRRPSTFILALQRWLNSPCAYALDMKHSGIEACFSLFPHASVQRNMTRLTATFTSLGLHLRTLASWGMRSAEDTYSAQQMPGSD